METCVLSGSAMGIIKPRERLLSPDQIRHGDVIILIGSSGIHANGLTMARKIAMKLPDGYLTPWPFSVIQTGHIEAGEKKVIISPKGLEFKAESLRVR